MNANTTPSLPAARTPSDEPVVALPSERPSATILDFIARVPTFLRRGQTPNPVGNHLTPSRMALFEQWWEVQHSILREYGSTEDQIFEHRTTAHLAWVTADSLREPVAEPITCSVCDHSPHAGGGGRFGNCTAIRQLDDGPHLCLCEEGSE